MSNFDDHINQVIEQHQFCAPKMVQPLDEFLEKFRQNSKDLSVGTPNYKKV